MANLIEKYPVPVILKKINKEMFSGQLAIKGDGFSKILHFLKGDPCSVSSTLAQDRLGEMLCQKGKINRRQLDTLCKARGKIDAKFGKLLVENNILSHRELYNALQDQMKSIAFSTFALTSGEWSFVRQAPDNVEDMKFEMSLPKLLLYGSQYIKDFSYFQNRFGKRVPVTLEIPEYTGRLLSADEIRFYVNMTKCKNISCNEILIQMGIPESVFWQKVVLMYLLDILEFELYKNGRQSSWAPATDSDVYRTMNYKPDQGFKDVECTDTASVCEKSGEYFAYSQKESPGLQAKQGKKPLLSIFSKKR